MRKHVPNCYANGCSYVLSYPEQRICTAIGTNAQVTLFVWLLTFYALTAEPISMK